ncbi:MAG: MORN repeat-containing protein [Magnetococcus sp. YQC-5]
MSEFTCSHCGGINTRNSLAAAGTTILCQHCGTPETLQKTKPPQPVSEALQTFLSYCDETNSTRNASFDAARIRRFETYLTERNIPLSSVHQTDIKAFLEWIDRTRGPAFSKGYEITLLKFFQSLTLEGVVNVNPLEKRRDALRPPPIPTEQLSKELKAFVDQQMTADPMVNLTFDINRIQVFEAFLTNRGKKIRTAQEEDIVEFIADQERHLTPKQVCGMVMTLHDLYDVLVETGLLNKLPLPYYFTKYQAMAELIIHSEELSQTSDLEVQQLRHTVQKSRDWRVTFFVTAGMLCGFGVFLAYQLSSHDPRKATVLGEIRQNAKKIQGALQENISPKPASTNPTKSAPPSSVPVTVSVSPATPPPTTTSSTTTSVPETGPKGETGQPATPKPKPAPVGEVQPVATGSNQEPKKPPLDTLNQPAPVTSENKKNQTAVTPALVTPKTQGCIEGDCQNGIGTFLHPDGARYTGHWHNGKMHGSGEFRFPTGSGYRGTWINGKLSTIY